MDPASIIIASLGPICSGILGCSQLTIGTLGPYLVNLFGTALKIVFVATAGTMLLISAFNMVVYSNDEGAVGESRKSFYYIIAGAAVIAFAEAILNSFGVGNMTPMPVNAALLNIIILIRGIVGIAFIANLVFQGFRLVTSQGEQEYTERARKRIVTSIIGAGVVILANVIVGAATPGGASTLAGEIAGMAAYVVTLIGLLAVIAILMSGFMLVISVDESLKDKAKTTAKVAIITLVGVMLSYTLVSTFITLG